MKDAIVFDTETTGLILPRCADLSKQPFIIELGAARVSEGKVVAEYNQLINPGFPVSEEITKITGITNEDLVGKPSFKEVVADFAGFVQGANYLIAHNAKFDETMLSNELKRNEIKDFPMPPQIVCTVQEFGHLKSKTKEGRLRLVDLYELSMQKALAQTHRALDDVNALVEILNAQNFWGTL